MSLAACGLQALVYVGFTAWVAGVGIWATTAFAVYCSVLWALQARLFLFRNAYLLELTETELRWRSPLRSGSIPLADLTEIRPSRLHSATMVLSTDRGDRAWMHTSADFGGFTAAVQAVAPWVCVRLGLRARRYEAREQQFAARVDAR
jgi:hypothetical protein